MTALRSPVQILLVEDSPNDAELMIEALQESNLTLTIAHVEDGETAIRYLRRQDEFAAATRPDLILLDLHLPRKSGHEVLAEIKQDAQLKRIPVIVMTAQDSDEAVQLAYDLHTNCYVNKPCDLDQFVQVVKKIESFWRHHARLLPPNT